MFAAAGEIIKARGRGRWVERRRTGRVHQQPCSITPYLERQLAFIGVAHAMAPGLAQRLVERPIKLFAVAILHRQVHYPLQQPGILSHVGIVDFVDLAPAVVIVVQGQQAGAEQHQRHHPPQRTLAQRAHSLPSTR
ncbi:hypothetical protein D3C78_986990 [compost metagenome]